MALIRRGNDAMMRALILLALACAEHAGGSKGAAAAPAPAGDGSSAAKASGPGGAPFDITKLGAKADGKADSTKALQDAWASACGGAGKQTVLIPAGDYLTGPLNFSGPCKGDVTIQVDGNLLASTDLALFKGNWIQVDHVDNLVITGKGKLDGQGAQVWKDNACTKHYDCKVLPNSLVLDFVNNAEVSGITLLNAKFFHINIFQSKGVTVKDVTITAPADSPNTAGIHMWSSSGVTVAGATIGCGDDCVSIGSGMSGVNVTGVTCGPGHGISVGVLGRFKDEKDVTDVNVEGCTIKNTTNGLRIKCYKEAKAELAVSQIHFENVAMEDVENPLIIDMDYCPTKICPPIGASKVSVKDVSFKNITGTSATPEVVSLLCSDKMPCTGITMNDVKVGYKGTNNKTMAVCENAKGTATGCLSELAACF